MHQTQLYINLPSTISVPIANHDDKYMVNPIKTEGGGGGLPWLKKIADHDDMNMVKGTIKWFENI